jgi:hypothetical protein
MAQANRVRTRDVFICFSKARPGEAKVAICLKDVLEQHGLSAFEYEDWSWDGGDRSLEAAVDRGTLRRMLTTSLVVVLISPHEGEASSGVQTEIAELRASGSPVILLRWSPAGWRHPLLEPERFEGLNIIWSYEGRSTPERDVADNQCEFISEQLARGAWLACQLQHLRVEHATTAGALLASIPATSPHALLNFRLRQTADDVTVADEDVDVASLAAAIAARATPDALRDFVSFWRGGTDLMAATLAQEARPPRRSRISRSSCQVHAIELSRFGQIRLTAATGINGRALSPHRRSC